MGASLLAPIFYSVSLSGVEAVKRFLLDFDAAVDSHTLYLIYKRVIFRHRSLARYKWYDVFCDIGVYIVQQR
jgi:hypothetical protein